MMTDICLETCRIVLRPIAEGDLRILQEWRNDSRFLSLCSVRRAAIDFDEFAAELKRDFERDRHLQFLILCRSNDSPIGTVYSYNFNSADGYAFVTIFIIEKYDRRGYGIEAIALFLRHLFVDCRLYKIYFEVYAYNAQSLTILEKAGFVMEGRFKGHRLFQDQRYDVVRFATYSGTLPKIEKFLARRS